MLTFPITIFSYSLQVIFLNRLLGETKVVLQNNLAYDHDIFTRCQALWGGIIHKKFGRTYLVCKLLFCKVQKRSNSLPSINGNLTNFAELSISTSEIYSTNFRSISKRLVIFQTIYFR